MKLKVESITPQRAKELLELNTGNFRRRDQKRVNRYAHDMRHGKWELNGETIKVSGNILIDGQHRLAAIVESGVTITSCMAYDVDATALNIDDGKPRSVGDWLGHFGIPNANNAASMAKLVILHNAKRWQLNEGSHTFISREDHIQFVIDNADKVHAAVKLSGHARHLCAQSLLGALVYLGSADNDASKSENATWFIEKLGRGIGIEANEPVFHLRNMLLKNKTTIGRKIQGDILRALVCVAWNKTIRGETVQNLFFRGTGPTKQAVPYVINETEV